MNPLKSLIVLFIVINFSFECIPSNVYVTLVPPIIQHLGFDVVVVWRSDLNCSQSLFYRNLVTNETGNIPATFDHHYDDLNNQSYFIKKVIIENITALQPKSEIKVGNENGFSDIITLKIPNDKYAYKFLLMSQLTKSNNSLHTISRIAKRVIENEEMKIPIILDLGDNSIDDPTYYYRIQNMIKNAYYIHLKQNKTCCHFDTGHEVSYGVINLPGITVAVLDSSEDLSKQINFINNPMFNFNKSLSMVFGGPEFLIKKNKEIKLIEDFLNETKADIYLTGDLKMNYHIRDFEKNISFINVGISSDQQFDPQDAEYINKNFMNNKTRYHIGATGKQSFGLIEKPPGLKAKFSLITIHEEVVDKYDIKSIFYVVDNSWTFEEITAIVVFIITLAFFCYFVYSWIMCTRSKPRDYDRSERDESTNIEMESRNKKKDEESEGELKMQIK